MATYKDPIRCFAPIEIIERLLEIRDEAGFPPAVFLHSSLELAGCLDAYGFDVYAFSNEDKELNYGDYRAPIVPGGENLHLSITGH